MNNYYRMHFYIPSWWKTTQDPSIHGWKSNLTQKPVQFDHVQLEVVNETVDIEEVAHQSHKAVT